MSPRPFLTKLLVAGCLIFGTSRASAIVADTALTDVSHSADKSKGIDEYEPMSSSISRQTTVIGSTQQSEPFCNPVTSNCFTAIQADTVFAWWDAYDTCTSLGLEFAIFEDVAEQQYLTNELGELEFCNGETPINMQREDGASPFKFKDDQGNFIDLPLFQTGYAGWNSGEPNNFAGDEYCVELKTNGKLNDCPCNPPQFYSCILCGAQLTASPTKAPTASPTASPTFSPAPPGSFEIHSTGNVTGTATSGASIRLTAPYNASNRVHGTTVLSPDCITEFTGTAKEAFQVGDTPDVSLGDGYIAYNSMIDVDISKVNETVWWTALSGGALGGVLDLCLESAVYFILPDDTNETMNFVNTNLTLTVEMDANFEVTSIDAERKDATKENLNVDYSQYVTAYQCTNTNLVTETIGEYSQGDDLKICVTSINPSIVQVESIKSLALSQAGADPGAEFAYITGGLPVDDEIAATDCDDSISPHVCHADMQLLGRYFAVDEPGDLTASGSVELTFDTGRRLTVDVPIAGGIRGGDLSLENGDSARRMQQDKLPEESYFPGVQVSLKSVDGSGSDYFGASSLVSGLVAAAGGAILMA